MRSTWPDKTNQPSSLHFESAVISGVLVPEYPCASKCSLCSLIAWHYHEIYRQKLVRKYCGNRQVYNATNILKFPSAKACKLPSAQGSQASHGSGRSWPWKLLSKIRSHSVKRLIAYNDTKKANA
eukprot:4847747-Pleurochrysis_carterae.AAC.1